MADFLVADTYLGVALESTKEFLREIQVRIDKKSIANLAGLLLSALAGAIESTVNYG